MSKIFIGLVSIILIFGLSGCAPSQEQLLLEKQKREKIELEKQRKAERLKEREILKKKILEKERLAKIKEAKKYLDLKPDNTIIYKLLKENIDYMAKDIYETNTEYKLRTKRLKEKLFGRKFVFDYVPEYQYYSAETLKVYIGFTFAEHDRYKRKVRLVRIFDNQYRNLTSYRYFTSDIPSNTKIIKQKNATLALLKSNCKPNEAQVINKNLMARFIVKVDYNGEKLRKAVVWENDNFAKTEMIIIYNKYTKEIYKVLY